LRLSYRIPLITGIFLVLTAIVNVVTFQVLSERYFTAYVSEIASSTPNPENIQAIFQIGKLNAIDQAEYFSLLSELANLSASIENLGKNPELYMSPQGATGDTMFSLPQVTTDGKWFSPFFDLRAVWDDTSEGRFVTKVLRGIILVNIIWLALVLLGYFLWVSSIFGPIRLITSTIQNIIDKKRYASIRYAGKNEFSPLITTINNLNKSLSIQEKIRSDFLSDLSHEIRTPITAVKCYLEAIQDGAMKLDTTTVDLLHSELTRLTDITERIMDYESLTNDVFDQVNVERFSMRKITEDIIHEYAPQLVKDDQEISTHFPSDSMTSMDKNMYIQILHNMISNFIKYAGKKTRLDISYLKTAREYIITFADNWVGIPEKEVAFVKEKFYRVDKARTGDEMSMGIGLSIVDRIAKLHNGNFNIEKNHPKWVSFIVRVGR
jgi:signal transduction histidine kinase